MRTLLFILFTGLLISVSSCRSDFEFEASSGGLQFSRDTVYLDTVFTNIGSSTYTLKVYNKSNKDIKIPSVKLGKGLNSKYRMTVDGMQGDNGKIFNNVELLAKDSMYIFIETTVEIADANPTDFLYTDQIQFDSGSNFQKVELVTLIQDAVFLYPQRDDEGIYETIPVGQDENGAEIRAKGFLLNGTVELNWTNEKPYVIYGYAGVPSGATLNIAPGARVHFHDGSGIIAYNSASIKANGGYSLTPALENEIIFEGDRLEPGFSDVPGQWGTIWLTSGSTGNEFNHVTIKNAVIGLYVQNNDVTIANSQIYDCSNFGILAQTATIMGENLVINSAGQAALACTLGGSYLFKHCTFNNNWASSKQVAVLVDNYYTTAGNQQVGFDLTQATFSNCIIYGSNQVEFLLNKSSLSGFAFEYQFNHCLIKFNDSNPSPANLTLYEFIRNQQNGNVKNLNPNFFNISQNKLNIDDSSGAFQKGSPSYLVPNDILNNPRNATLPDLGAYTNQPFPE